MHIYRSEEPDLDIPPLDLLTYLFGELNEALVNIHDSLTRDQIQSGREPLKALKYTQKQAMLKIQSLEQKPVISSVASPMSYDTDSALATLGRERMLFYARLPAIR